MNEKKEAGKKKLEWWIFRCAVIVFTCVFLYSFLTGSPALQQAAGVLLYFAVVLAGSRWGGGTGALTGMVCGVIQALRGQDLALLGLSCVIGAFAGLFNRLGKAGTMAGSLAAAAGISALSGGGLYDKFVGEFLFALAVFAILPKELTRRAAKEKTAEDAGNISGGDSVSAKRLLRLSESFEKLAQALGHAQGDIREGQAADCMAACTVSEVPAEGMEWRNRYYESQEAIGAQLHEMGEMIAQVAGEISGVKDVTGRLEQPVRRLFAKQKLNLSHMQVLEYENGRQEAYLTLSSKKGKYLTAKEISELMAKGTRRRWHPSADGRSVVAGEPVMVKLEEETNYRMLSGVARKVKADEAISGDTFSFSALPMGKMMLCLSDGMGSGESAFAESEMVTDLAEQLLEAGFSIPTTVKIINSVLLMCREEQHPTTLDLCVADLYTGQCEILKQGACPTFIRRGNQVEVIDTPMLPAGMLSGIDLETTAFQLEDGDMVVMATDGVLDGMEGEDKEESFRGLLASCSAQNPKELAEQLLSSALRDRDARDDMTVLTAGIWKK